MSARWVSIVFVVAITSTPLLADEVLYRYEGDVLPYDPSAGWIIANPCEDECSESLEDGHFVLTWPEPADLGYYDYEIAQPPDPPPPSLWVEWRFRSNHPLGPYHYGCDATFYIHYGGMADGSYMYGDAGISLSGDDSLTGLDIEAFHTYRYESRDGVNYRVSVDGVVFMLDARESPNGYHYLQFGGFGGCGSDWIPNMVNEWDFVRFGTISDDEQIIATDPPQGYLDPVEYPEVDRFSVTFDSANNIYVDDITVQVTGGVTPQVEWVLRHEEYDVDTVEIVLDQPIPMGQATTFTIDDGYSVHVIEYTYINPIPTASTWGVLAMLLLVLTAGTIVSRGHSAASALLKSSGTPP